MNIKVTHTDFHQSDLYAYVDDAYYDRAIACARGEYQRGLIRGFYRISGGDLKGKAKQYGARYAQSAANLCRRMRDRGIPVWEAYGRRGQRILVIADREQDREVA